MRGLVSLANHSSYLPEQECVLTLPAFWDYEPLLGENNNLYANVDTFQI
jgi:hypothetical protein